MPDTTENFPLFGIRDTLVHAQSELLEMTGPPLLTPASGSIAAKLTRDANLLAPIEGRSDLAGNFDSATCRWS